MIVSGRRQPIVDLGQTRLLSIRRTLCWPNENGGAIGSAVPADQFPSLLMLVFFVLVVVLTLFLFVTPFPVVALITGVELPIIDVVVTSIRKPLAIGRFLLRIPVMVIAILRIVYPPLAFLLFVPFMIPIILRTRDCHRPNRQQQRNRYHHRTEPLIFTTHVCPPEVAEYGCRLALRG